jgi:hypothetical protein
MILKREVVLRAVVTEKLKQALIEDVQAALARVDESQEELDRQSRRLMLELQRQDLNRAMSFRQQLDIEKRKHEDAKAQLQEQLTAYRGLEIGTEIIRGTLESNVELKVGDNFEEKMGRAEILIEDDKVKEIRDPAPARDDE